VRDALSRAERNVAAGAPPDEDAAREWSRVTRWTSAVAAKKNAASRSRDADGSDGDDDFDDRKESQSAFGGKENANAGSRPNAYVPAHAHSEGLPKPYGLNAPFKPAPTPPHLRHYKPPIDGGREDE
jgi:hypothetical protein